MVSVPFVGCLLLQECAATAREKSIRLSVIAKLVNGNLTQKDNNIKEDNRTQGGNLDGIAQNKATDDSVY